MAATSAEVNAKDNSGEDSDVSASGFVYPGEEPESEEHARERRKMNKELRRQRQERDSKHRAASEIKAKKYSDLRDISGLSVDVAAFEAALDASIAMWKAACKDSRQNMFVWCGPEDTSVDEVSKNDRIALELLSRALDNKQYAAVLEIERSHGFHHCLTDGYNSDASLDYSESMGGRASKVSVRISSTDDAFGLLQSVVDDQYGIQHNKAALKSLKPLLRGVLVAAVIDYSCDNHTCWWDEGSFWPSACMLIFEYAGKTFSLVVASMGWTDEWE
jgi:hypothetical protein